jgi:tetratricopeptide (TPR) repeat protein
MSIIQSLHEAAMDLAEQADVAKLRGELENASQLLHQALDKAVQAANQIAPKTEFEPTRSIIHRSAASLAIELQEFQIAESMITTALAGNPPSDVAEDLRDLFVQMNLPTYLARRGLHLDTKNWVLSQAS